MTFLIFLFLCLFSTKPVSAKNSININSTSGNISVGSTFSVSFNVSSSDIGSSFNYKFFGGIGDTKTQIETASNLHYTGTSWSSFPIFTVGSTETTTINTTAYIKSDSPGGTYNLFIKLNDGTESPAYSINVLSICNYTYSDWGVCSSDNKQTRTATLTSNNECVGTSEPVIQSCTYDPTIVNPDSGISINEFMPYGSTTDKEWVELFNNNDKPVKLIAWKIMDSNSGTRSFDLSISAKSYGVVEFSSGFLNNDGDKVILINNNGKEIDRREYSGNNYSLDYSWSLVSGSWCRAEISKGTLNNQNCYLVSTPTLTTTTISLTPTPDSTKYTPDEDATASAIIEPKTESSFISPTSTLEPTIPASNGLVLGDSDSSSVNKKNYLPLVFIFSGALLLASPIIIDKIKKYKK